MTKPGATSTAANSRAVPHVVVRAALGDARHHRQDRLFAVEGLDLALLVDAENQCPVGWRQVEADDIDERRIVRHLESLAAVRLQAAHIRRIVVWEKPVSAAVDRIDQCVASAGLVRSVRSITAAI